jgi:acyl-CoA synthetase (AMP-forming)/AMP-acid ligase II
MCNPVASFSSGKGYFAHFVIPELAAIETRFTPRSLLDSMKPEVCSAQTARVDLHPESPALITFTSGSTGLPKAIVRSHQFLYKQMAEVTRAISLQPGTVHLTTLPIVLLANIARGVTSVIPPNGKIKVGSVDIAEVLNTMKKHSVTELSCAPAFLSALCEHGKASTNLSSLQQICTGGGPIFPDLIHDVRRVVPRAKLRMIYGSTECEPISIVDSAEITPADLSLMRSGAGLLAGRIWSNVRLKILPVAGAPFHGSQGAGEIAVTGDHVIKGYLNGIGDAETKISIDGEIWHRTGDAGYIDETGRLWLLGRCSALVSDRFGPLFPYQVECAVRHMHPGQRSVCLSKNGERILFIETPLLSQLSLHREETRSELSWANIHRVIRLHKIPVDRRHSSKIDYAKLRKMLRIA